MTAVLSNACLVLFIMSTLTGLPFLSLLALLFAGGATLSAISDTQKRG